MAASLPDWRLLLLLALLPTPAAAQQSGVAAGKVVRLAGADSIPVAGAALVLHRITHSLQGPIDSLAADGRGRFRFRLPPDTSAVYLVSARFAGIEYFSPPLRSDPRGSDSAMVILVSDTSTTARILTGSRHVVISALGEDGTRGVLEIIGLVNQGDRTRISPDSSHPVWTHGLPKGTLTVRPGQGDFSPDALVIRHDSILLFAPLAPGEKQLVFSYALPATIRRLPLQFEEPVSEVNVLVEDRDAEVTGGTLARADTQVIEGRTFRRWAGAMPAVGLIVVGFPGSGSPVWLLPGLVALIGLALLVSAGWLIKRRAPPAPSRRIDLVGAIAALDARYLGHQDEVPAAEWQRYLEQRTALKQRIELAQAKPGS
ncbi:MAG: hypothetical protein ABJC74_14195 [Gemmatimonadota bacterium]